MTLSPERIRGWIDSLPITAHIADTMDHNNPRTSVNDSICDGASEEKSTPSHKEEGEKWMEFGSDGHQCISHELSRLSHPLKTKITTPLQHC